MYTGVTKVSAAMAEVRVSGGSVRCQQQGWRCHVHMGHKGVRGDGGGVSSKDKASMVRTEVSEARAEMLSVDDNKGSVT